ncbi:hypothetical protein BMS3Bbin01_03025 [bacterium BMS3Bbin01]|nr:hypothetical protein BMS3Bbin01_03025 [bacterium BMS3Bbin01]
MTKTMFDRGLVGDVFDLARFFADRVPYRIVDLDQEEAKLQAMLRGEEEEED